MLRTVRRWLASPSRRTTAAPTRRSRLGVEALGERVLPAVDWLAVSSVVSAGQTAVASRAAALTDDALSANLPAVKESLGSAVKLGAVLGDAVKVSVGGVTTADQMVARLRASGFTVLAANTDPNATGTVLLASKTLVRTVSGKFTAGDVDGFRYWDATVNGGLSGGASVSGKATAKVTFGVNLVNGQLSYWLSPDSTLTVTGLKGTGRATGTVGIGALGRVSASANYAIDLTAAVKLRDLDGSGRVELDEFRNRRGSTGDIDGSVRVTAAFAAKVAGVGLTFQGKFDAAIHNSESRVSEQLLRPNYESFGRGVAMTFFAGRPVVDVLAPIQGLLNKKVPFTNKTVADFIKLNGVTAAAVGINPGITSSTAYDTMLAKLKTVGVTFTLTRESAAATLDRLMRGEKVDLIRQTATVSKSWSLGAVTFPIGAIDVGIVGGSLSVYVTGSVGVKGTVTVGLDTSGVYVGSDTALGVTASVSAGFEGKLTVLHIGVAKASGGLTLKGELNAKLKDPTPGDGKVYVSELKGKPLSSILGGNLTVDLGGELKAKVNTFLFGYKTVYSKSFNFARLVDVKFG